MNYSKAFTYVFEDPDWVTKILIAGLIGLIPVVGWIYLAGWEIEIIRRVRAGRTDILPRTHFSDFLSLGLKSVVVGIVMMIPSYLISGFTQMSSGWVEKSDSTSAIFVGTSIGCFSGILGALVSAFLTMMLFAAMIRLAQTNDIKSSISYEHAFRTVKSNFKLFLIVYLFSLLADLIGVLGVIFCIIGLIFTSPYGSAILGHLIGQLSLEMAEAPAPIKNAAVSRDMDFIEKIKKDSKEAESKEEWVDPVLEGVFDADEEKECQEEEETLPEYEISESEPESDELEGAETEESEEAAEAEEDHSADETEIGEIPPFE